MSLPTFSAELPPISQNGSMIDEEYTEESIDEEYESDEYESEEDVVKTQKVDPDASFFATFIDGCSFRYLIEYLRLISLEGTFIFHKNYITYAEGDDDHTILNIVKIKTYELTDYEFSSFNDKIIANINLSDLRNKTRTVGKKEQLDIYRRAEEPSNLYIQVRSQEKSSGDNPVFYCMSMKSDKLVEYDLPEYNRGKRNPNCTIYQSDFSKVCKALVANKCSYVEFLGYDKGIVIKGYSVEGKIAMVKEYGKRNQHNSESKSSAAKSILDIQGKTLIKPNKKAPKLSIRDADEIDRFRVPISKIKALTKLNGFSPNGTIKIYIERGLPMKFDCNIGTFGKLSILIRS